MKDIELDIKPIEEMNLNNDVNPNIIPKITMEKAKEIFTSLFINYDVLTDDNNEKNLNRCLKEVATNYPIWSDESKDTKLKEELQHDSVALKEKSKSLAAPEYIANLKEKNPQIANVIQKHEQIIKKSDSSDIERHNSLKALNSYKGIVAEKAIKSILEPYFVDSSDKQILIETQLGNTKPDILLSTAHENIQIDGVSITKGENLGIEVKCGNKEYIFSQLQHILKQVQGLGDNALVIVTKDYLDLPLEKRSIFENAIAQSGSGLYVLDINAYEVDSAIQKSKEEKQC